MLKRAQSVLTDKDAVLVPMALILLDRAVTLQWWGYEANAYVEELGVYWWVLLTVALLVVLPVVWYRLGMHQSMIGVGCVWLLTLLHGLAVVTNLAVVTGVL